MRLTKQWKTDTTARLITEVTKEVRKQQLKDDVDIFAMLHKTIMSEKDMEYIRKSPIGPGAFPSTFSFYVNVVDKDGNSIDGRGNGTYVSCSESDVSFPVYYQYYNRTGIKLGVDSEEHKHLVQYKDTFNARKAEINILREKVQKILEQATTLKKLQEMWPELEAYLPGIFEDEVKTKNLPAVQVHPVNVMIAAYLEQTK